jgi:hypothetical protein
MPELLFPRDCIVVAQIPWTSVLRSKAACRLRAAKETSDRRDARFQNQTKQRTNQITMT